MAYGPGVQAAFVKDLDDVRDAIMSPSAFLGNRRAVLASEATYGTSGGKGDGR